MVDAISLLVALLFIELLGLTRLLYWRILRLLHADYLCQDYVISILVGVLDAIEESH